MTKSIYVIMSGATGLWRKVKECKEHVTAQRGPLWGDDMRAETQRGEGRASREIQKADSRCKGPGVGVAWLLGESGRGCRAGAHGQREEWEEAQEAGRGREQTWEALGAAQAFPSHPRGER